MVLCTLEQRVLLYDTCVKYETVRKCQRKFRRKFRYERVPSRQTIHNLVNNLRTTELLMDKKQKHKCRVLTEEKLDDIGARLQHTSTSRKSLKRLAQETGMLKSGARTATQLLKLIPCTHNSNPRTPCSRVIQLAGFILQLVCTFYCRRWVRSAVDILFWWRVVSPVGIKKYAK
jgi:hypothetical protein